MECKIIATIKTGKWVQRGWTEGIIRIDGWLMPAPNYVLENEKIEVRECTIDIGD